MGSVNINKESLKALSDFMHSDDKDNVLDNIDSIIEGIVRTGMAREYFDENEIAVLFDLKDLVKSLQFPDFK